MEKEQLFMSALSNLTIGKIGKIKIKCLVGFEASGWPLGLGWLPDSHVLDDKVLSKTY